MRMWALALGSDFSSMHSQGYGCSRTQTRRCREGRIMIVERRWLAPVAGRRVSGPMSRVMCGLGLIAGYALLLVLAGGFAGCKKTETAGAGTEPGMGGAQPASAGDKPLTVGFIY